MVYLYPYLPSSFLSTSIHCIVLLSQTLPFSEAWTISHHHHHHHNDDHHNNNQHGLFDPTNRQRQDSHSRPRPHPHRHFRFQKSSSSTLVLASTLTTSNNNNNDNNNISELILFNSKSRSKEPLKTVVPNKVSMYTCGPTVYDYAHVGNFRAFLTYDLIKRVLLYFGYDVTHICNLTDVDDKIINRANENGIKEGHISELTQMYEEFFFEDLKALNVILANNYPRATEHIKEMMEMILELADKDLAYETDDGSWYFSTSNQEGYGKQLVQLNTDEMKISTETVGNDMKRNVRDFALWKAFKEKNDREDASWEEPTGKIKKGRPGWHLECSAMARKYLGDETIDLHCGGCDLQFPHHENEIAQSEGVTGKTYCTCWMHNGFVNINDEKMSKSLGNFLTLRKACPKAFDVRAFRFFVISSQYQKQLSFTPQAMDAAKSALKRIDKVMQQIDDSIPKKKSGADNNFDSRDKNGGGVDDVDDSDRKKSPLEKDISKALINFDEGLLDDLSMPRASASLFALIKLAENEFKRVKKAIAYREHDNENNNVQLDLVGLQNIKNSIQQMDQIFGIFYDVPLSNDEKEASVAFALQNTNNNLTTSDSNNDNGVPAEVMDLVAQRTNAKESKDWELADSLRFQITELGFVVKDMKGGRPIVSKIEEF